MCKTNKHAYLVRFFVSIMPECYIMYPIISAVKMCDRKESFTQRICTTTALDVLAHVVLFVVALVFDAMVSHDVNGFGDAGLTHEHFKVGAPKPLVLAALILLIIAAIVILLLLVISGMRDPAFVSKPLPQFITTMVVGGVNASLLLTTLTMLLIADYPETSTQTLVKVVVSIVFKACLSKQLSDNVYKGICDYCSKSKSEYGHP